ncbi:MAG TPA: RHS repeat-associated core domain-containing protein, partial [Acidimicrobiales bacterium]|nr:RHS repeat-associated core domain-containing protein [Acidimicrobiales bacterium]
MSFSGSAAAFSPNRSGLPYVLDSPSSGGGGGLKVLSLPWTQGVLAWTDYYHFSSKSYSFTPGTADGVLSADGRTFVGKFSRQEYWSETNNSQGQQVYLRFDDPYCDGVNRSYYNEGQIMVWRRSTRFGEFGDPELLTKQTIEDDPCAKNWEVELTQPWDVEPFPTGATGPRKVPALGTGWGNQSQHPSVSADGSSIAFRASADGCMCGGASTGFTVDAGIYISDNGGGPVPVYLNADLEPDMGQRFGNHDYGSVQVSDDGLHVLFATASTGVVPGLIDPEEPIDALYMATRSAVGADDWTFELVSKDSSGDPVSAKFGSMSQNGSRVAYIQDSGASSRLALWTRDSSTASSSRYVVSPSSALTAVDIGDRPGVPSISADGTRIAIMARSYDTSGELPVLTDSKLRVFDADLAASASPTDRRRASLASRQMQDNSNGGGSLAVGGSNGRFTVAMQSGAPLARYGNNSGLYLIGSSEIPDPETGANHADPVEVATGSFTQHESDLSSPSGTSVTAIRRDYSSLGEQSGIFGPGWATAFDMRLAFKVADGADVVSVELPDGRIVDYSATSGSWANEEGYLPVLEPDALNWTLTETDGAESTFDSAGRLISVERPGDPVVSLDWEGEGSGSVTVSAGSGYSVELTDDQGWVLDEESSEYVLAAGPDGLVDRVVDSEGRQVDYGYQVVSQRTVLHTVSKPHLVGQAAGTFGTRTYDVDEQLRITSIVDDVDATRQHTLVENTYETDGRVAEQVSDTGDVSSFQYDLKPNPPAGLVAAPGFTTVTDAASGATTVYEYGLNGEVLGVTDAAGQAISKSWEEGKPTSFEARSGATTSYTYDAAGRPLTVSETAGGSTRVTSTLTYVVPDSSAAARADDRIATSTGEDGVTTNYTYDGDANEPDTVSVPCDAASLGAGLSCPSSGKATTSYRYFTGSLAGLTKDEVDPDGVKTSYTYHADRSLASSTTYEDDGTPRTTTFDTLHPGDSGWPFSDPLIAEASRTESPGGAVSWEGRDAQGQTRESRDPLYNGTSHKATRTAYRLDGSVASVTDPADHTTTFDVHRPGDSGWSEATGIAEVRISTDADGISSINKIDRSGYTVVSQTGNLSVPAELATTTNTYGDLGRLVSSTGPTGIVTSFHYDAEGRTTGTTIGPDPDDAAHTFSTEYDARGQVLTKTLPLGTDPDGTAVQRKVSYTYDSAGRTVSMLEGSGGPAAEQLLTGYVYDSAGRLWRTIEHRHNDTDTANPTTIHAEDRVTETRYTLGGRTAQVLGPPVDVATFDWASPDAAKSVVSFSYDDAGRRVNTTAPDGGITETAYDEDGRISAVTSPGGAEIHYLYDAAGHRTGVVSPSGLEGPGDPTTVTALTGYDAAGRVISETDPHIAQTGVTDPSARTTTYTSAGRVATVTDANGNTVTYGYDSRGNRTSRTATDDASNPVIESWTWNLANQQLTHTVPPPRAGAPSQTSMATYDPDYGWLATATDPTSRVQTHAHYNDGTLKQTTFTRSTDAAVVNKFWVNGRGWRTKSTSATGAGAAKTWTSSYDRAGQKVTETGPQGTISHSYGLAGEQTSLGYPDGAAISTYLHDPAGRLTDVSVTSGGITVPYVSYSYDSDGHQTSELIHAAGGATRAWDYNDAGQLASFTEVLPNTTSTWETYTAELTYRPDGRLATETVNSDPTITYSYDDAGQLTSAVDGVRDRSWTYGTRGNRLTSVDNGVTTTYTTNPNASVAKTTEGTHTVTYGYDDAGRRLTGMAKSGTTTTGTTTTSYTTEGYASTLVVAATGSTTTSEVRGYDADGKLVKSDTGGGTTVTRHYQWDTTQPVPQIIDARNSGSTWFRATWGNQRIAFQSGTAAPQWFQYDVRGSVIRTDTTNTDVVAGPQKYSPFGEIGVSSGADRIGYRGELTASNFVHLRARNYDSVTGQFTTRDPLDGVDGTPVVADPYHYVDNDPINKIDPLGLTPVDCFFNTQDGCRYIVQDTESFTTGTRQELPSELPPAKYTINLMLADIRTGAEAGSADVRMVYAIFRTELGKDPTGEWLGDTLDDFGIREEDSRGPTNFFRESWERFWSLHSTQLQAYYASTGEDAYGDVLTKEEGWKGLPNLPW